MSGRAAQIDRVKAALLAELGRQSAQTGCTMETNSRFVQVDGSFEIEPLARAAIAALADDGTA